LGKESSLEGRRMREIFYRLLLDMFRRSAVIYKQKSSKNGTSINKCRRMKINLFGGDK
jgi:hypothetical protein